MFLFAILALLSAGAPPSDTDAEGRSLKVRLLVRLR
jgi:hypothetical protein